MILKNPIKKIIIAVLLMAIGFGIFGFFGVALAQQDRFGLESATGVGLAQNDLKVTIINIIRYVLSFLGLIAVIIIMYGGYLWMTAAGDSSKIEKAKKTLISAVIGLIIILSAFIIVSFVINSLQGALCEGDNCPTASCPSPPCTPTCTTPPCSPMTANQYTYVNQLKDSAITWTRSISSSFSGVARIPNSATLEIGGYAKNKNGTVSSMTLFTAPLADTFASQSQFIDVPTDREIVNNVFASWNSLTYAIGDQYKAKISALFSGGSTIESRELKTIIRPTHCFNNIADQSETGVDCGGDPLVLGADYCGACDGGTCQNDSDCASGICLPEGTCAVTPIIDSIEPSNGASGNYITIWGRNLGASPGEVQLLKNGVLVAFANVNTNSDCLNGWNDTQIIFEVPDVALDNYDIVVANNIGLISNSKAFEVNEIQRPGICSVNPVAGTNPEPIQIIGNNFPTAPEGQVLWNFQPAVFSSLLVKWLSASQASDVVPESGTGKTSLRIYNGTEYSNYFNFIISRGEIGDPCGEPGASVCSATNVCNPGLSCSQSQDCTCQVVVNACEPGFSRDCDLTSNTCTASEVCPLSGNWDEAICTQVDSTCASGISVQPASQSLFAWAFSYSDGDIFKAPQIIEDCSRVRDCYPDQKLPSPSPWYEGVGASEGWDATIHPNLSINNPKACVDATISARFTQKMDAQSVKNHVRVYKCTTKEGSGCTLVSGEVSVYPTDNGVRDYFKFGSPTINNQDPYEVNAWYKVVLTKGIKSLLNVEMIAGSKVIGDRFCNVAGVTDAVYCWNFQTRDTNTFCKPGCPECNPDPETFNYYLQSAQFNTELVSEDNVCLTIDPWAYNWNWSSEVEDKVKITNNGGFPQQTGTAYGENYNIAPGFTKIFAKITQSGQQDYCRVTTDFTNPVVMEESFCSNGTIQSPTPWINSTDACRNALISARFSRDMNNDSLTLNTTAGLKENAANSKNGNIIVEKCGNDTKFSNAPCASIKIANPESLRVFTYSHNININDLLQGGTSFGQGTAEGFVIDINSQDLEGLTTEEYLTSNTWYRVIILGGTAGVRGSDITNADKSVTPGGILLTANSIIEPVNSGWDYNGDGLDDYYWAFKTSDHACDAASVQVTPAQNFLEFTDQTSQYDAFPQASNCNVLARCLINWTWKSLIELDDNNETGAVIAPITKFNTQSGVCGGFDDGVVDPVQIATAKLDGETNIRADEPGGKSGSGRLQVGYGDLAVTKYSPQNLVHFETRDINAEFNIDAKMSAVKFNENVNLYKCTEALAYYKLNNNPVDNSGNKYDAFNKGIAYSTGYFQQAASFRGIGGSYIQIDDPALRIPGAISVSAWVKATAPAKGDGQVIISNYYWGADPAKQRGWTLGQQWGCNNADCSSISDDIYFSVYDQNGKGTIARSKNFFTKYQNQWVHVTGVFMPGSAVRIYINGKQDATVNSSVISAIAYEPNTPTRIGHRADSYSQGTWIGLIDDVKIYNSVLSTTQILNLYSSQSECPVSELSAKSLNAVLPSITNAPALSKKIMAKATTDYKIGAEYRLILKGGPNGLIGWNDNELSRLNFNSTGNNGGEECEPGLYPWTETSSWSGGNICLNNATYKCVLNPNVTVCDTAFEECKRTDTVNCNLHCQNAGNINTASCGNGVVEASKEECDDGNTKSNDGCTSQCLWEGADDAWGSICGNTRVEYGESCDDGNVGGCTSSCLKKSGIPTGSVANLSVCGNGLKELGEDCDDGNTNDGDGCSFRCLFKLSSSGTTCGNNLVESGQNDSYSWTFEAINDPDAMITMNNCANGIWQVGVKRGNISSENIYICQKDINAAMLETNVWGKIIARIKMTVANFFGMNVAANTGDGCGAGYSVIEQNASNFEDRMEYMNEDVHVYSFIKNGYFDIGKKYKVNVFDGAYNVNTNNIPKVTQEVTILEYCKINDVKVEIWPRGVEKYNDNFFCVGDECGRSTESKYDNDVSATWNIKASLDAENVADVNYDFPYLKANGTPVMDVASAGNQHLYMAWAVNRLGYLIKSEGGFTWKLANLPKFDLTTSEATPTNYQGDRWINLNSAKVTGSVDGDDLVTVVAKQIPPSGSGPAVNKSKDVNIKIFLCNNPWPAPESFPYRDALNNCLNGNCPNTNFEIYYCRDNGVPGSNEDLPTLDTSTIVYTADISSTASVNEFKKEFLLQRSDKNDAVGIRILANDNHYSPLVWYRENFDPKRQGNPQSVKVNGYEAIKEGRTVYANAINVEPNPARLFPSIYLVSYSADADEATQNIYTQMIKYLKFNVGSVSNGGLPSIDVCQGNTTVNCRDNSDCEAVNAGACLSSKGKLTRDTKRLADIQDVNWLLSDYHNQKRCSTDKTVTCFSSSQCFGGGTCDNFYPDLAAGSYITGRSFSVWPSWQATLGNVLGSALPVDPLNASSGFSGCATPYDAVTCWNDIAKEMQCPTEAKAYSYLTSSNGAVKNIYAFKEFEAGVWRPNWSEVNFINNDPFSLTVASICRPLSGSCGNGRVEAGENCHSCPFDVGCTSGKSCRDTNVGTEENWQCTVDAITIDSDGDGKLNNVDNCPFISNATQLDSDNDNIGDVCDNCRTVSNINQADKDSDTVGDACDNCPVISNQNQDAQVCATTGCGDNVVQSNEVCDEPENPPSNAGTCNATCSALTYCGDGAIQSVRSEVCDDGNTWSGDGCSASCKVEPNWTCIGTPSSCTVPFCGDGIKQTTEVCDCGDAAGPLAGPSSCGNSGVVYTTHNIPPTANLDVYFSPFWTLIKESSARHYCNNACQDTTVNIPFCGDGVWKSATEQCEGKNPNNSSTSNNGTFGWGQATSISNQWACSSICTDTGGWCGDGTINTSNEQCDPNNPITIYNSLCQNSGDNKCQWTACPPYLNTNPTFVGPVGAQVTGGNIVKFTANNQSVDLSFASCESIENNQIHTDITVTGEVPSTEIVFVTDLSRSMNSTSVSNYSCQCDLAGNCNTCNDTCRATGLNTYAYYTDCDPKAWFGGCWNPAPSYSSCIAPPGNNLQATLKNSITKLFDSVPNLKIGLVEFSNEAFSSEVVNSGSKSSSLFTRIDGYKTVGGTFTNKGLLEAQTKFSSTADNKIIIVMSDGVYEGTDPSSLATALKGSGIKIYSAAFGGANASAMNNWSSNNGSGTCNHDYCRQSTTELGSIYDDINNQILDSLLLKARLTIGTAVTNLSLSYDETGVITYNNQVINLPNNICDQLASKKVAITNLKIGDNLSLSNVKINYCPYHPPVSASAAYGGSVNGHVAGASEEIILNNGSQLFKTLNNISNLFFTFMHNLIKM